MFNALNYMSENQLSKASFLVGAILAAFVFDVAIMVYLLLTHTTAPVSSML